MNFNDYSRLKDRHAFLSPSSPYWYGYDEEKLDAVFTAGMAAKRGTDMHTLAALLIKMREKMPRSKKTLNMYVNDCVSCRMTPEQTLYYSDNCFGHADAISLDRNMLRIFDLKTGVNKTSVRQLEVYAALFCLEYRYNPFDLEYDLRIYQSDECRRYDTDPDEIMHIMEKIRELSRRIDELKEEGLL